MPACKFCQKVSGGRGPDMCNPRNHSPGGTKEGTVPFRPGKTKRDKARRR